MAKSRTYYPDYHDKREEIILQLTFDITEQNFQKEREQKNAAIKAFKTAALKKLQVFENPTGLFSKKKPKDAWNEVSQKYCSELTQRIEALSESSVSLGTVSKKDIEMKTFTKRSNISLLPLFTHLYKTPWSNIDRELAKVVDALITVTNEFVAIFQPKSNDDRIKTKTKDIDKFVDILVSEKLAAEKNKKNNVANSEEFKNDTLEAIDEKIRKTKDDLEHYQQDDVYRQLNSEKILKLDKRLVQLELCKLLRQDQHSKNEELRLRLQLSGGDKTVKAFNKYVVTKLNEKFGPQAQQQVQQDAKSADRKDKDAVSNVNSTQDPKITASDQKDSFTTRVKR